MLYITYNDPPSGIYSSQVVDVCKYIADKFGVRIRLVAFISLKGFSDNRKKIKEELPSALIFPMFPGVRRWRWNIIILFLASLFLPSSKIICRGPFATALGLRLRSLGAVRWVCFDGRGAYTAEFNEYDVSGDPILRSSMAALERKVVTDANMCIAVSQQLVKYWEREFSYNSNNYVIIPCTLNSEVFSAPLTVDKISEYRAKMGYGDKDIIAVYSGSSAGWQSLELVDQIFYGLMQKYPDLKMIFMVRSLPENMRILEQFPSRVKQIWLKPSEVHEVLMISDYGVLVREFSVTNQVSSPVKFAEYLAAGLKVLISEGIGDYTEFVRMYACGEVLHQDVNVELNRTTLPEKLSLYELAKVNFSKLAYYEAYRRLIE